MAVPLERCDKDGKGENVGLRIGILGQPDGWYVRDLLRAAEDESLEVISFRDLATDTHAVEGIVVRSVVVPHDITGSNPKTKAPVGSPIDVGVRCPSRSIDAVGLARANRVSNECPSFGRATGCARHQLAPMLGNLD